MVKMMEISQNQVLPWLLVTSKASLDVREKALLRDRSWFISLSASMHTIWLPQFSKRSPMQTILYCCTSLKTGRTLNQDAFTLSPFLKT